MQETTAARRRELMRQMMAEAGLGPATDRITRHSGGPAPLSYAQRSMWLHHQAFPHVAWVAGCPGLFDGAPFVVPEEPYRDRVGEGADGQAAVGDGTALADEDGGAAGAGGLHEPPSSAGRCAHGEHRPSEDCRRPGAR